MILPASIDLVGVNTHGKPHNPESLEHIFPNFIEYWNNTNWNNPLRWSINWYVESNRGGGTPDGRIIWVQSALELLSWTYFVTEGRMTKEEFKALKNKKNNKTDKIGEAEAGIRKLFKTLNIPTFFLTIPTKLQNFELFIQEQRLKGNGFKDYLQAFIRVRNNITHPEKRFEPSFLAKIEALQLGLWYLELTLLGLFKYQGCYANRLEQMNLEPVPWAFVNKNTP